MRLQQTVDLGCKGLQRENHEGDSVRVWIKFVFTAERAEQLAEVLMGTVLPADGLMVL